MSQAFPSSHRNTKHKSQSKMYEQKRMIHMDESDLCAFWDEVISRVYWLYAALSQVINMQFGTRTGRLFLTVCLCVRRTWSHLQKDSFYSLNTLNYSGFNRSNKPLFFLTKAISTRRKERYLPSHIELWNIPFLKLHACASVSRNPTVQRRARTRIL